VRATQAVNKVHKTRCVRRIGAPPAGHSLNQKIPTTHLACLQITEFVRSIALPRLGRNNLFFLLAAGNIHRAAYDTHSRFVKPIAIEAKVKWRGLSEEYATTGVANIVPIAEANTKLKVRINRGERI